MTSPMNAVAGCLLVGDYLDEAEIPATLAAHGGEVVRPQIVADSIDHWANDDDLKDFTVLLKDGRVVGVRGHSLKHEPHPVAGQDVYCIVVRSKTEDVLVALFKSADVAGIFHGDLRDDRKIA